MKTKILLSVFLTIVFVFQSNAQIKVLSNGAVALAGSTVPSGYCVNLNGFKFLIGGKNGYGDNSTIIMDFTASDPRIAATYNNRIVLYNTSTNTYNDLEVRTLYQNSDVNAKTNISDLKYVLSTIKKLRGVTFNWKDNATYLKSANAKPAKLEYGLIAQEVEKVVPELVITNDSTNGKMLSYIGIIPILIEAIKEQQTQIETLKQQVDVNCSSRNLKSGEATADINSASSSVASLSQNAPNPFNQTTQIDYYLPDAIGHAVLYIYNMNGNQIKSIPVKQKGKGSVTINGSELQPGMYIYTLVADGTEVDTKRMILTN